MLVDKSMMSNTLRVLTLLLLALPAQLTESGESPSGWGSSSALCSVRGKFECRSGDCIPLIWKCDGESDCSDGSDEENCTVSCTEEQLLCVSLKLCISMINRCDGHNDCMDNSDEQDCPLTCGESEFKCKDEKSCVLRDVRCDGNNDCEDGSDEDPLLCSNITCTMEQFKCLNTNRCIDYQLRCNKQDDCGDYSDEEGCPTTPPPPPPTCGFGMFNCTSGGCVSSHYVCDGTRDCDDGSDELYCGPTCFPREFRCEASNLCILESWKCDGEVDCMEGEDEVGCPKENCTRSQFDCGDKCIPFSQRCDGWKQCDSGADEFNCSEIRCTLNEYQCRYIPECISGEKVCDRVTDCYDGSDETGCSRSVTTCDGNHGCEQLCIQTKNSFFCKCRPGYQLNRFDGRSCIDIDECATPGVCTQLCHNSPGSYSCECVDGYTLLGGNYCKADGDPAYLLYASLHSISKVTFSETRMFSGPSTIVIHNQPLISGIDYDLRANKLYWGDLRVDTIMRSNLDGTNKETFTIPGSVHAPEGVAVDWVTGNVYWVDGEKKTIEVSDKSGQHRKILVWENLDKPRGLVLDPTKRLMYWSDWGESPKIERASMDGSNRTLLHSTGIHWPNAIALDIPTQTLYWADPWYHSLQSSHVNGTNRRPVLPHGVNHAYDMTLFQDTAYWSDWASKSIYSGHKYSSANPRHVQSTSSYPMGLKVVHITLQPMVENPCSHNNSGCSQLCLLSSADSSRTSCACALGYKLQPDGRSCKKVDTFLIVARMTSVLAIPLYQKTLPFFEIHLPLGTTKGVSDVAWDSQQDLVFWTDKILKTISVSHISGKNTKQLFTDDVLVPEGITYDWLTKKIYWVDRGYQRIEVADITGENRAVLVSTGLSRPRGIVVHPYEGYLYWTDWGRHSKIERINLDGTNRMTVVDLFINNETHMPNHMDIDFETNRIYWVEYNYARIMYANLDGTQVTKVGVDLSRARPIGLAVHGDYVYWSNTERIKRTSKALQGYFRYDIITPDLPLSLGMEVFHRNRTIVSTPCDKNNGGCSHLCLTKPAPNSEGFSEALAASCVCPTGFKLMEDGKTCANDITKFLLVADKSALKMISLDVDTPVHTHIPITGTHNFNSVDYDPIDDTIYWVDLPAAKILKVPRKGGNPEVILDNLDHPNSIAIDWIGRTMYFSDSGSNSIEVAHLNGTHRKKLIWDGMGTPRSLTINIKDRLLYWIEWGENTSHIESSFLDGTGRKTVVGNLNMWPQGLTVDTESVTRKMYWIGSMTKAAYKLESPSKSPTVVIRSLQTPAGLAVMDNNLYYTEVYSMEPNGVVKEFREGGPDRILSNRLESPYEVKAYDRSVMGKTDLYQFHPCSSFSSSTGCSHLCLPSGRYGMHGTGPLRYSCACPSGIRLENDNKTCKQAPHKFLIYGTVGAVHRISMDTSDMADVVINRDAGFALSMDFTTTREPLTSKMNGLQFEMDGYIFWSENSGFIKRMWLNGSCPESNCTFFTSAGSPRGLAVDWVTGNVYFVDLKSQTLRVVSYDGQFTKTIVSGHLDRPRAVAVDPKNGYLFYSDWGDDSRVERSDMSGSERHRLTKGQDTWPNEIAIDYSRQHVYWSDGLDGTIKAMEIDGGNQRKILKNLQQPFGVVYHSDRLYWSQWGDNALYSVSLRPPGTGGAVKLTTNSQRMYGVNFVHGDRPQFPSSHPCVVKNGGCPFFCLMLNPTSWKCGCPDDMGDQCVETFHTFGTVTDTPTANTPTSDTSTINTLPTNTSTVNTPITDPTDDSETPTTPTDTGNTPRPTDDDSSGTPTGDTTGSVATTTFRTDTTQTPHSPNTGGLDKDVSNGTIFGINPGIFSAYVVISFLGIAISAMIIVVCIVTLNVCRRKKALNETLKKGQLNKVAYYNTTPVKDLSTRSKKDLPGVTSHATSIAEPSSKNRTHDSHMISMDTLSQGSSEMVLEYPTIVELKPGETSSPLDLLRTESRDSGMA